MRLPLTYSQSTRHQHSLKAPPIQSIKAGILWAEVGEGEIFTLTALKHKNAHLPTGEFFQIVIVYSKANLWLPKEKVGMRDKLGEFGIKYTHWLYIILDVPW